MAVEKIHPVPTAFLPPGEFPLAVTAKVAYLTAGCWETKGAARSLFPQQFTE